MKRKPVIVAFVMLLSSGLVHALWSDGQGSSHALEEAVARVSLIPATLGPWQGKPLETDAQEFEQAGADGYWMRRYERRGRSVTVLLMCGRAGRMAVHTPEFCYQGLGYQMVNSAVNVDIAYGPEKQQAQFWTARFSKQLGVASDLRLFWSWNAGNGWQAPSSPRWDFRGAPFLYKLYVVHETNSGQPLERELGFDFLKRFLPELEDKLFDRSSPADRKEQ